MAPTSRRDSLMFILRAGANCLAQRLEVLACGARQLVAALHATEGEPVVFTIDTSRPTADAKGIATLLLARFERIDTGERWFEALELRAPSHEPIKPAQQVVRSPGRRLDGLLDELTGRLGARRSRGPSLRTTRCTSAASGMCRSQRRSKVPLRRPGRPRV